MDRYQEDPERAAAKKHNVVSKLVSLKVHKNENFFGFSFEFCTVALLVVLKYEGFVKTIFDWVFMGGGRIFPRSLKTTGNKIVFKLCQKTLFI